MDTLILTPLSGNDRQSGQRSGGEGTNHTELKNSLASKDNKLQVRYESYFLSYVHLQNNHIVLRNFSFVYIIAVVP